MLRAKTQKAEDAELAVRFTEWYCKAHHADRARVPLVSDGVTGKIYGARIPILCEECATYARYVEVRTERCPHDPKPFCAVCPIKCYKKDMAQYSREVMRWAAPRSFFSRYCPRAIAHAIQTYRYRINLKKI
ncbi:MAG: nitrous oxide-stimulated promoter family protein [Coriobacteriia bacterium]|nr:nitrous oxide-stimulated promoter family protein [Coriobacteriia bacterium]